MAEIERIHSAYGAGFGADFGPKVHSKSDRQRREHASGQQPTNDQDTVDLHAEDADTLDPILSLVEIPEPENRFDISA